jgi:hypothetical protein
MSIKIMAENLEAALIDLEDRQLDVAQLQGAPQTIPTLELLDRAMARLTSSRLYLRRLEANVRMAEERPFGRGI